MRQIIIFLLKQLMRNYRYNNDSVGARREIVQLLYKSGFSVSLIMAVFIMSRAGILKILKK